MSFKILHIPTAKYVHAMWFAGFVEICFRSKEDAEGSLHTRYVIKDGGSPLMVSYNINNMAAPLHEFTIVEVEDV